MTYLEQFQRKKVFGLDYAVDLTGNVHTAKCLLQRYSRKGYIARVRRNLYAALDLASKTSIASRYEIACALDHSACISHHSALEFHGVANQVFHAVTVSSEKRIADFEFEGIMYHTHMSNQSFGVTVPRGNPLVRVTDLERTFLDCLSDVEMSGGLEELMESFKLFPSLDLSRLLEYLNDRDTVYLWQKTGLVLRTLEDMLLIPEEFFNECRSHIHDRKRSLGNDPDNIYYPEWKLYAPPGLHHLYKEGDETLV